MGDKRLLYLLGAQLILTVSMVVQGSFYYCMKCTITNKGYDPLHTRHYMLHLEEILTVMPSLARIRPQDMVEAPDMQFIFPLPSLSLTHFFSPLRICQNDRPLIRVYVFVCVCMCDHALSVQM